MRCPGFRHDHICQLLNDFGHYEVRDDAIDFIDMTWKVARSHEHVKGISHVLEFVVIVLQAIVQLMIGQVEFMRLFCRVRHTAQ